MATGCDLTGRTERETLVNQLGWASGWLSKLAKEYKSFKEVISSCLTTLAVQKDSSLQDRCSAVCMMLKGALSTYNERYYEDDGTYDVIESVTNSADRMEKLAKENGPFQTHPPLEKDPDEEISYFDQKMFEQNIGEFLRLTDTLQGLYAKYASKSHAQIQVHMKVIDGTTGHPINVAGLDPVPLIKAFLDKKREEMTKPLTPPQPAPVEAVTSEQPTPQPEEPTNGVQDGVQDQVSS